MDLETDSGHLSDVTKVTVSERELCVMSPGPGSLSRHLQLTFEDNDIEAGDGSRGRAGGHVMTGAGNHRSDRGWYQ